VRLGRQCGGGVSEAGSPMWYYPLVVRVGRQVRTTYTSFSGARL